MQLSTFATIVAVLLANVFANETTPSSSPLPVTTATDTCVTITTQGSDCPKLPSVTTCRVLLCLGLETVTLSCGCPSIFTTTTCPTTCITGCGETSYSTHFLSCPTTPSSTSDTPTESSEPTTAPSPSPTASYSNSTITTATRTGPTLTTSSNPPLTANSAKKWGSDSVLSGLMVAILGLL